MNDISQYWWRTVQTIQSNCLVDNRQIINALEQKPDNLTVSGEIKFFIYSNRLSCEIYLMQDAGEIGYRHTIIGDGHTL